MAKQHSPVGEGAEVERLYSVAWHRRNSPFAQGAAVNGHDLVLDRRPRPPAVALQTCPGTVPRRANRRVGQHNVLGAEELGQLHRAAPFAFVVEPSLGPMRGVILPAEQSQLARGLSSRGLVLINIP